MIIFAILLYIIGSNIIISKVQYPLWGFFADSMSPVNAKRGTPRFENHWFIII